MTDHIPTHAQPQPELPLSGEGTRCFLCQGDTNPDQYGEMQMIKQHVEQPEATEPMGICDCGFTADECGTNHCMRKKIHLAGMTPGSKWPEGAGAPSVLIAYGDADAKILRECGITGQFVPLTSG